MLEDRFLALIESGDTHHPNEKGETIQEQLSSLFNEYIYLMSLDQDDSEDISLVNPTHVHYRPAHTYIIHYLSLSFFFREVKHP